MPLTRRQRRTSRHGGLHERIERRALRSCATSSQFVKTPTGREAVVEICDGIEIFVRYEDGSHYWLSAADCEPIAGAPSWYMPPALTDMPGGLGR